MILSRSLGEPIDATLQARQFVAGALVAAIDTAAFAAAPKPLPLSKDSSPLVAEISRRNKIAGLLKRGIIQAGWDVPEDLLSFLEVQQRATIARNLENLVETSKVCAMLQKAGIEFVIMKGAVRSHQVFNALDARPSGDIDILVPRNQYADAGRVLCENGFSRGVSKNNQWWHEHLGESPFVPSQSHCIVDVHHKVQQPGGPSPFYLDEFILNRATVLVAGREFEVLHPDNALLLAYISVSKAMRSGDPWLNYAAEIRKAKGEMSTGQIDRFAALSERQGLDKLVAQTDKVLGAIFALTDRATGGAESDKRLQELAVAAFGTEATSLSYLHRTRLLWQWTNGSGLYRALRFIAMTRERVACDMRRPRADDPVTAVAAVQGFGKGS